MTRGSAWWKTERMRLIFQKVENFYLCYDENEMVGVISLKFSLTDLTEYLLNCGGH